MAFARQCVALAAAVIFLAATIECQLETGQLSTKQEIFSPPAASQESSERGSQSTPDVQSTGANSNPSGENSPTAFSLFDIFRNPPPAEGNRQADRDQAAKGENNGGSEGGKSGDFVNGEGDLAESTGGESPEQGDESSAGANGDDSTESDGQQNRQPSPSEPNRENGKSNGGSSEAEFPVGDSTNDGAESTQGQQKPDNIQSGDGDGSTRVELDPNTSEDSSGQGFAEAGTPPGENEAKDQKNKEEKAKEGGGGSENNEKEGTGLAQVDSQSSANGVGDGGETATFGLLGNAGSDKGGEGKSSPSTDGEDAGDQTGGNQNDGGAFEKVESELRKDDNGDGKGSGDGAGSSNGGGGESGGAESQSGASTKEEGSKNESGEVEAESSGGEALVDVEHSVAAVEVKKPEANGSGSNSGGNTENGKEGSSKEGQVASKPAPPPPATKQENGENKPKKVESLLVKSENNEKGGSDEGKAPQESSKTGGDGSSEAEKVESAVTEEVKGTQEEAVKDKPPAGDDFKTLSKATEENGEENGSADESDSSERVGGEEEEETDSAPVVSESTAGRGSNSEEKNENATLLLPPLEPKKNGPAIEPFTVIVNGVNNVTVVEPPGTPTKAQLVKYATPPPGPVELEAGGSCGPERWSKNHYAHARHGLLNDGTKNITANNMQCCRLCHSNPACRSWTRVKQDQPLKKAGECWLFNHVPRRSHAEWADSGISPEHKAQGKIVCDAITFEFGFDHPSKRGVINEGHRTFAATNHDCCMKCRLRSNCRSWTRITNSTASNQFGECWMRDWVPPKKKCDHCDSGVTPA